MIPDSLLLYPDTLDPRDIVSRVRACLAKAEYNKDVWCDPRMDWQNYIQRVCWEYGIHPAMVLVSLQRERSLFGQQADERDFDFALGVVGQDAPGTTNERWNGLPNQILLGARTMAWLAGIGPEANFGFRPGLYPNAARWVDGGPNEVKLYTAYKWDGRLHPATTRSEYAQLCFTPHLEVLETNEQIYNKWFKSIWEV